MKVPRLASGALLAAILISVEARAQEKDDVLGERHRSVESPQHFAIELRFAPFTPDIDSDPALKGRTPFGDLFGSKARLLIGAELDWQALRIPHLGTVGPGLSAGYTTMSANAPFATPHNGTTISGEQTSLDIFPFYAIAVLRADVLWHDLGIPLVPYAKAGVGYALWRASNTLGTSISQGVAGKGHSLGTHLALGLGLNLNAFDRYAARNFDNAMGVNNTYLFAELTREDLTGLGLQKDPLRVGGMNWTFGLAFEF
jgi:hypothetical protein